MDALKKYEKKIMPPEKVLVFQLNWLGDILFSFPLLRAIKTKYPKVHLACAVVPRYAELLVNNPWVDEVIHLSDRRGISAFTEKMFFALKLRGKKFDVAILLKPSNAKAFIARCAGIPLRLGFSGKRNDLLTRMVEVSSGRVNRTRQLLELAVPFGADLGDDKYQLFVSEKEMVSAAEFLRMSGILGDYIVLNPGGNWGPKRWKADNFVDIGKRLAKRYPKLSIVVTGAKKDVSLAGSIAQKIGPKSVSIAGKTSLRVLAAILKKSRLVISADSGPMHLSSAVGTPTIALFGPTASDLTGPNGKAHNVVIQHVSAGCEVPCYKPKCDKDLTCMDMITAEEVEKIAGEILGQ